MKVQIRLRRVAGGQTLHIHCQPTSKEQESLEVDASSNSGFCDVACEVVKIVRDYVERNTNPYNRGPAPMAGKLVDAEASAPLEVPANELI